MAERFKRVTKVTDIRRVKVVSDGTVVGTMVTDTDTGERILCDKITWELDIKSHEARCTISSPAAVLEYEGKAKRHFHGDEPLEKAVPK